MSQKSSKGVTYHIAAKPKLAKSVFVVIAHYLALGLFSLSVWSGVNIARDQHAWEFLNVVPGMQSVHWWHLLAAVGWLALMTAYCFYDRIGRPRGKVSEPRKTKVGLYLHVWTVRGIYFSLSLLLLSGGLLWSQQLGRETIVLRYLHLVTALFMIMSLTAHFAAQLLLGWWPRFKSSFDIARLFQLDLRARIGVIGIPTALIVVFAVVAAWWQSGQVIIAPRIEGEITIDGVADEAQWKRAKSVTVTSYYGLNQQQSVPIEVKMMNDGYSLYVHARWPDPTKSLRHLPLLKTTQGWRVQQTQFLNSDESEFYEDKLAVMLAANPWDALRSVFLSPGVSRGGHRIGDRKLLDVWHWKSVRNHGFANLDDAFFGADLKPISGQRRYTWGYASDPLWAGSYVENWEYFMTDLVRPLRLPRNPERLREFQKDAENDGRSDPVFGMHWVETQPYHEGLDTYPIGTVMPSVIWYHPNEGDRADVRASGIWKDGFWELEMARNFETDSDYDLTIGNDTYFWFASFDHTQVRHTYHLRPLRLRLEK